MTLVSNVVLLLLIVGWILYIAINKDSQTDLSFKMFVLVNLMIVYVSKISHQQKMKKHHFTTTHLDTASL